MSRSHRLLEELHSGKRRVVWLLPDGRFTADADEPPAGLLPGAFNPLHVGHRRLREVARARLSGEVPFELSIRNADKPPIDPAVLLIRSGQFRGEPVALTSAATFVEKSELFPETGFVVGVDTAVRILDVRFYNGRKTERDDALRRLRDHGCRFLVAGRMMSERFRTLPELAVPDCWSDLFLGLSESDFRVDVSSTHLRQGEPD